MSRNFEELVKKVDELQRQTDEAEGNPDLQLTLRTQMLYLQYDHYHKGDD